MAFDINELIERFNDGDNIIIKVFGDYNIFFKFLERRGLMGEIDPKNGFNSEYWQNEYLIWAHENNKPIFQKWVSEFLGDVIFDENGKAFLTLTDRGDLSDLFCDSRRYGLSRGTVQNILSEESDYFEYFYESTDNAYRDVIEELNKDNLNKLYEHIVEELDGQELSPETELMSEIAISQGHPEYWTISPENVSRIVYDEESINSLLDDELEDLRSNLYSLHSSSYNSAYEEEIWEDIWNELQTYFDGKGEFKNVPHPYKKETMVQNFVIPINSFDSDILSYLDGNKGYGNTGTLEYQGSYLNILREDRECLSARVSDYPDSTKVDNNINEMFNDYI
jgi:hypothetical protein